MQIQPVGAAFFRPARAIESRSLYGPLGADISVYPLAPGVGANDRLAATVLSQKRQLRGLGDTDVGATIGNVAGAAANIIGSIFGAQSAQANAAGNAAVASSNERIAMAQLADAAETRKTYMMLGVGVAALAVLGFALK